MKKNNIYKILLLFIFIVWNIVHIAFLELNGVLKVADSFAYLQMSEYLQQWSIQWLWTGWFGAFYSIFIAGLWHLLKDNFLSAQIMNILFFNISAYLLYKISWEILTKKYVLLVILLFFLSPILLHFNSAILSENIYIPLFLWLIIFLQNFLHRPKITDAIICAFFIALMYFTRWEAFIYLGAISIIGGIAFVKKRFTKKQLWWFVILLFVSFWLFVFPYVFHLHTITGDWWLSNKGSSNLRQATLRGKEKMDDSGFEQAVAELTMDKQHLIAWFAGGLAYDRPRTTMSLKKYIGDNFENFMTNWWKNQIKLYTKNIPHITLWDSVRLYQNEQSHFFYKNIPFFIIILIPIFLWVVGIINLIRHKKTDILIVSWSFFIIASIFFTLFFTLDRYFIIFIPIIIIIIVYWIQTIDSFVIFSWSGFQTKNLNKNNFSWKNILKFSLSWICIWIYMLGLFSYYNSHKLDDSKYTIKKHAGQWLKKNHINNNQWENSPIRILERFPIVTYYSGTQQRFITPYTSSLNDILQYSYYNNIDYLVVDSLDFRKYRPQLKYLLNEKKKFWWLKNIQVFTSEFEWKTQKVIIYKIEKLLHPREKK